MILNAEQILEALKKELSFQNHDCRIDIVTKRPEEIITGFEHILKELEKIQITLETKKIEVKFKATSQPYHFKCKVEIK